jgi:hypothetical protein
VSYRLVVTLGLSLCLVAFAACGDDDDDSDDSGAEEDDGGQPGAQTGEQFFVELRGLTEGVADEYPVCAQYVAESPAPQDVSLPDECQEAVDAYVEGLEAIEPPEQCQQYYDLVLSLFTDAQESGTLRFSEFNTSGGIGARTVCLG